VASSDGGATWATVLTAPAGGSLMGCRMLSKTEAWMSGGGMVTGKGLTGYYYHTTDGGANWELTEVAQAYSMDLSFYAGVGYSAALNQAYSSIAVYN
jgi:Neuraminidase (sialidase)